MPGSKSRSGPVYHRSWQDLRRRDLAFWLVVVSYVPAMAIAILATGASAKVPEQFAVYVAATWLTMFVAADLYRQAFHCPRCGHHFFRRAIWRGPDSRNCLNCGLPLWAGDEFHDGKAERLAR